MPNPKINVARTTTFVESLSSSFVVQETFFSSSLSSWICTNNDFLFFECAFSSSRFDFGLLNFISIVLIDHFSISFYRVRRDSNPRPATLEIAALPAELHTLVHKKLAHHKRQASLYSILPYWRIFVTVPAPIVLPPSRIANLIPSSIAIG